MAVSLDEREIQRRMARIESLLHELEQHADPRTRTQARELVQALLDVHGAGLERILQHLTAAAAGPAVLQALTQDGVVASLLLLHDLHPQDTETRVRQALEKVRPTLQAQQCSVELLGVAAGVARLRLCEDVQGAAPAGATFTQVIEEAICASAPEITNIEFEWPTNKQARIALPLYHQAR